MIKKTLVWAALFFLVFFVVLRPESASDVFSEIGSTISTVARNLGEFFSNLVK